MSRNSPSLSPQGFWSPSARESARNSRTSAGQDPPRPAREGFEWVWFPEGYWAERPSPHRTSSKSHVTASNGSAGKIFKWTPRASGCPAPSHEHDLRESSPKTVKSHPVLVIQQGNPRKQSSGSFSPPRALPQSPWLSEAAQVQALQRPVDRQMSIFGMGSLNEQSRHARKRSSGDSGFLSALQMKAKATKSKSTWNLFQRSKVSPLPTNVLVEGSESESNRLKTLRKPSQKRRKTEQMSPHLVISISSQPSLCKLLHHRRRRKRMNPMVRSRACANGSAEALKITKTADHLL